MGLRTSEQDDSQSKSSPIPGLPYFWQEAEKQPESDWTQKIELFELAVLARH